MFIPNRKCQIKRRTTRNIHGEFSYKAPETVKYALVRYDMRSSDSTVRADSSATRGNIREYVGSGRVLFKPKVEAKTGDLLIVEGEHFRIKEVEPRFNVLGQLDHLECDLEKYHEAS